MLLLSNTKGKSPRGSVKLTLAAQMYADETCEFCLCLEKLVASCNTWYGYSSLNNTFFFVLLGIQQVPGITDFHLE